MKYLLTAGILILFLTSMQAQITFEHEEWARVRTQAKAENKIIFVDAYTTWCGPCKWMSKNVFTDASVGEFYNANFVNLKLDMEKGEGLGFAKDYEVNAYPTLLFIDGDGRLLHKHLGAIPADQFLVVGQEALSPDKRIGSFIDKYDTHQNDKEFLAEYLVKMLGAGMQVQDAGDLYFSQLDDNEVVSEENLMVLQMLQPSMDSKAFQVFLDHRTEFAQLKGNEPVDGLTESVLNSAIYQAIRTKDPQVYSETRAKVSAVNVPQKDKILLNGDMEFNDMQGNKAQYLAYAEKFSKTYLWNDWNGLNNLAWDMYLNKSLETPADLKLANTLGKRAVKLQENYFTTDTYASVLYKSGKYKQALKWANKAVATAKAGGEDPSVTEILIEKIEAAMQ